MIAAPANSAAADRDLAGFQRDVEALNVFDVYTASLMKALQGGDALSELTQPQRDVFLTALGAALDKRRDEIMAAMTPLMMQTFSHAEIVRLNTLCRRPVMRKVGQALGMAAAGDSTALLTMTDDPEAKALSQSDLALVTRVFESLTAGMDATNPQIRAASQEAAAVMRQSVAAPAPVPPAG